jgi:hypothetical protein
MTHAPTTSGGILALVIVALFGLAWIARVLWADAQREPRWPEGEGSL